MIMVLPSPNSMCRLHKFTRNTKSIAHLAAGQERDVLDIETEASEHYEEAENEERVGRFPDQAILPVFGICKDLDEK